MATIEKKTLKYAGKKAAETSKVNDNSPTKLNLSKMGMSKLNMSKLNMSKLLNKADKNPPSSKNNDSLNKSKLSKKGTLRPVTGKPKGTIRGLQKPNKESEEDFMDEEVGNIGNLGEIETVHTKTMKSIENALELFKTDQMKGKGKGSLGYELIEKDDLAKLKEENEKMKKQKKELGEEYNNLKEKFKTVEAELEKVSKKYAKVEQKQMDSVCKTYTLEEQLNKVMVENCKIQNEIDLEKEEKNNIFRALIELKEKYSLTLSDELEDALKKIKKDKTFSYEGMLQIRSTDKLNYLQGKLESLQAEIEEQDKKIEQLELKKRSLQSMGA